MSGFNRNEREIYDSLFSQIREAFDLTTLVAIQILIDQLVEREHVRAALMTALNIRNRELQKLAENAPNN